MTYLPIFKFTNNFIQKIVRYRKKNNIKRFSFWGLTITINVLFTFLYSKIKTFLSKLWNWGRLRAQSEWVRLGLCWVLKVKIWHLDLTWNIRIEKKVCKQFFRFYSLIKPPDPKPVPEPSPKTCSSSSSILFDNDLCSLTTTWTGGFRPCFNFNEETDVEFLLLKPVSRIKVLWSSVLRKC